MTTTVSIPSFDPSTLLSYYQAKLITSTASSASSAAAASQTATNSATANDDPPWNDMATPSQQARDAQVLSITNFMDTSSIPPFSGTGADAATEADNQKLFALYNAINNLSYLASMAKRDGNTPGQLAGYNTRFQQGLQQVEDYINSTTFNDFTLQTGTPSSSVTSGVSVPFADFGYTGNTIVSDANIAKPLAGVSADQSFTIAVKKGGQTTNINIDLSQVQGGLTIDNIVNYVNQQLKAAGFSSRFQRVMTEGTADDPTDASYGIEINSAASEQITLSSAAATPALYVAGTSGTAVATDDTAADNQGRVVKLTNLSTNPTGSFNATVTPSSGNTTAQATVADANGNVYVVGNATGNFGNQLNQGTQDVYLTKYDSAGNLQWTKLLGSAGTASGYSLALNPSGGVVVTGSTTANLTPDGIGDGNTDSFVAEYDTDGNQTWVTQLPTLNTNQANAVSVDASGNVYIGGQVTGVIGSGVTKDGKADAYLVKLDSKGNITAENQFGTTAADTVAATATTASGDLVVASVQNGEAILSKYAGGDITSTPEWQMDLGALNAGGAISGVTVSGNQIYVSGTTSNGNLTAGGAATVANASSGGSDAFVFNATDNGASATAGFVSYVGTSAADQGGAVTVGPDGTVYLAGTTTGTFAGQIRNVADVNNMFVTALNPDGSVNWTRQYGGASGQSTGQGIAIDAQGSSVLDALGLPRGVVETNQSVDLTSQTTLRAGDSFQIQLQGSAARNITITIDQGETLNSLVTKINAELGSFGKASVAYESGGEGLKIQMATGVTATLAAPSDSQTDSNLDLGTFQFIQPPPSTGSSDFDALSRLGITPGTTLSSGTSISTRQGGHVYGLGIASGMDISTSTGAGAVVAQLSSVLQSIQNIYQAINSPPPSTSPSASTSSGPVPAILQSQLSNYTLALNMLSAGSSSASSTSIAALV